MVYCQAFGCRNRSGKYNTGMGKSFHDFPNPQKRPEAFKKWAEAVKKDKFLQQSYIWTRNDVLCSDHFVKADFEEDIRAKIMKTKPRIILKKEAVPSILLSREIKSTQVQTKEPKAPQIQNKISRGSRCMVGGCGNTNAEGFSVHVMGRKPVHGEPFTSIQTAWIDFIGRSRKKKFTVEEARAYKDITICAGHFEEKDYDQTQLQMYRLGIRKQRPQLQKDAVPTVEVVKNPFPPDYLVLNGIVRSNQQSLSSASSSTRISNSAVPNVVLQPISLQQQQQQQQQQENEIQSMKIGVTVTSAVPTIDVAQHPFRSSSSSTSPAHTTDHTNSSMDLAEAMSTTQTGFHAICVEYLEDGEEDRPGERQDEDIPGKPTEEYKPWEDNKIEEKGNVEGTLYHSKGELHSVKVFPPNSQSSLTSPSEWTSGSTVVIHAAKPSEATDKPASMSKTPGGLRCALGGCTNTWYKGFSIHEVPKKKGCTRDGWIQFITSTRSDFNPNDKKRVYLCSGHFDPSQYEPSQVRSYQFGIRFQPPRLLPTAVPYLREAVQPFPVEWFIGEQVQAEVRRKRSLMSSSALYKVDEFASTQTATAEGGERRKSTYSRKKEVERILEMYDKKEKEKLKAEEERQFRAQEEIKLKAEYQRKLKAAEKKRLKAEEEKRLRVTQRLKAEEERRLKKEEEQRLKAVQRLEAEEKRRLKKEEEKRVLALFKLQQQMRMVKSTPQNPNIVNWGKWGEPDCNCNISQNSTVSENQESSQEDGNQTNQSDDPDAVYIMFVEEEEEEESPFAGHNDRFSEEEVHKVLMQEASKHTEEGDKVAMFRNWEEFTSSETVIHDDREAQALLQEESNEHDTIDDEDCVQTCLNLLRGEVIPSFRPKLQSTTESKKHSENSETPYFEKRDHQYHTTTCKKQKQQQQELWCVMNECKNSRNQGYSLHEMPKKRGPTRRRWIEFIKAANPDFRIYKRKVLLCNGHFERTQYIQYQVRAFQHGYRRVLPKLLCVAVPHHVQPVHPFPLDWFLTMNPTNKKSSLSSYASNPEDAPTQAVGKTGEKTDSNSREKEVEGIQAMCEKEKLQAEKPASSEQNDENSLQSSSSIDTLKSQHHAGTSGKQGNQISLSEAPMTVYIKEEVLSSDEEAVDILMMKETSCSGANIDEDGEQRSSLEEAGNRTECIAGDELDEVSLMEAIPTSDTKMLCAVPSSHSDVSALITPTATLDDSARIAPIETLDEHSARIPPIAMLDDSALIAPIATLDDSALIAPIATLDDSARIAPIATLNDSACIAPIAMLDDSALTTSFLTPDGLGQNNQDDDGGSVWTPSGDEKLHREQ